MRHCSSSWPILAILIFLCGSSPSIVAGPDAMDAAEKAVREELERYYADLSARDWDKFASHFWDGAMITTVWQPPGADAPAVHAQTVPEFVAAAPEGPGSKPIFEEIMNDVRIQVAGGLAQAWAHYSARFGDSDKVMEWTGIDAITLIKHDDRWKITSIAFAPDH